MSSAITVQHIPSGHPYVARLGPSLPDPPVPGAAPGQWWPHPALSPEWVARERGSVDVVHLHFGFEHLSAAQLQEWVDALGEAGIPLVFTVHDLVNPHVAASPAARAGYDALLDVLVPAASAVTTLTDGAARVIERRWGRAALVIPHPHLVDADQLDRPRPIHDEWVVTAHLKSLRANVDLDAVAVLREAVASLQRTESRRGRSARSSRPAPRLRVHLHDDVLDPRHPRHDPRVVSLIAQLDADPCSDLRVHGPLTDAQLWTDLLDTDLAVLPYRSGTHSGWLEMCHDLGTTVLAPDLGHLGDQRPVRLWRAGDTASLTTAVAEAYDAFVAGERPVRPPSWARLAERDAVARAHRELYAQVLQADSARVMCGAHR